MGASAIAALLKWPAIVAGVLLLLYGVVKLIQRGAAKRATATDDLKETEAILANQQRIERELAKPPLGKRELLAKLRERSARALRRRFDE